MSRQLLNLTLLTTSSKLEVIAVKCQHDLKGLLNNLSVISGDALRSGIDILVGTPGRVLDWVNKGALDTSSLEHVVLDEVDQMLDMGFAEDVENIISASYHKGKS